MVNTQKSKTKRSKTKKSKKLKSLPLKSVDPKILNPFELKINRQKHDILGRKISKHEVGKPFQSRSKAVKKRKETLLVEYSNLGKANSIIDRRIGEYDKSLSSDQKRLKRWAKARKYNLADSDEELGPEETLTHFGQSSVDNGQYDGFSDDSEDGKLSADIVATEHFSGGGGGGGGGGGLNAKQQEVNEGERPKTHYERMQEILKKKNEEKLRRDVMKEQMQTKREQLDEQLKDNWTRIQEHMKGAKERFEKEELERGKSSTLKIAHNLLVFEKRGTPSERLKTQEQLAREEKERLSQLESERLKRMAGEMRDEEATVSADALVSALFTDRKIDRRNKRVHESDGEDKETNVVNDDDDLDKDEMGDQSEDEDDDDDDDDDSKDHSNDDSNDDSVAGENSNESEEEEEEEEEESEDESDNDDLDSNDELDSEELSGVKINSSEKKKNKDKDLETLNHLNLFEMKLSSYFEMLANSSEPQSSDVLSDMTSELVKLGVESPVVAGQVMGQMIERLNALSCRSLPRVETLLFLKLVGSIFPTSDRRHPIVTPVMLLMSKMLTQGIVRNCRDIVSGLFLSALFLEFVSLSKRFVPEAVGFLSGVLCLAAGRPADKQHLVLPNFRPDEKSNPMKFCNSRVKDIEVSVPLNLCRAMSNESFLESDELRINCLAMCLNLASKYRILYGSLPAVDAIFSPMKCFIDHLNLNNQPKKVKELSVDLESLLSQSLIYRPLANASKKPQSIKLLEPKIDEKFDGRKKLGGTRDWREKQLAVKKCKKMKKDAERELRRDQRVLQGFMLKEISKRKMAKDKKVKQILSSLASQEGDWKSLKKGKKTDF